MSDAQLLPYEDPENLVNRNDRKLLIMHIILANPIPGLMRENHHFSGQREFTTDVLSYEPQMQLAAYCYL